MSLSALNQVDGLQELLDRCQRLIRVHAFLRGLAETLCVLIAGIVCACALDYLIGLPSLVRMGLLAGTVLTTGVVAWKRLIHPILVQTPSEELGAAVDLQFPDLQESVATLISLQNPNATLSERGSSLMGRRLQEQVETRIRSVQPSAIIQPRRTFKRCVLALISVIAILIPVLLWPSGAQLLAQRLFTPFANLAVVSNLHFEVPDANRIEPTHADVRFIAIPQWRTGVAGALPADVEVEIIILTGQRETLAMTFDETLAQYSAVLSDIRDSLRYRIRGGGATSEWFTLQVADRPRLLSAVLQETPPGYTGRPVEVFDGVVGDIPVFERSQIEIRLNFNKPVKSVRIDWKDWSPMESAAPINAGEELVAGENQALLPEELAAAAMAPAALRTTEPPVLLPVFSDDGRTALFQFEAQGSGKFEFHAEDELGLTNTNETTRRLIVSTDTPPKLTVTGIADGLDVRPDDVVPLNCHALDDLGVRLLELHVQKNKDTAQIQSAEPLDRGAAEVSHEFRVNLTSLMLVAGDTVTFRVRAADDRPVPGPQIVWQGPFTITIADNAEPLGQKPLREADQQLVDSLRKIEEKLQQDAKTAQELKEKSGQQWDEAVQEEVRAISEKEQTQGNELRQLAEQTAEHPLMQKQAKKLTELAQQMRQNLPEKLNRAASADRETAVAELQNAESELNRLRQELHNTVDEIEKLAQLEQELAELNRLALEAEQLAKDSEQLRQEQAADRPEEGQSSTEQREQQALKQNELQNQQQQLSDDLARLLQRKQELLQAAREAQLDQAAELATETRQLAEQQQRIAEGVSEEAQDTAREAQALADELQKSRGEADQLNQQIQQQAPEVPRPELQPLDDAVAKLREGNLFTPQQNIEQAREQLTAAAASLKEPKKDEPIDPAAAADEATQAQAEKQRMEQNEKRQELASKASQVNNRLKELNEQIAQMAADRGAKAKPAKEAPAPTQPEPGNAAADSQSGDDKTGVDKTGVDKAGDDKTGDSKEAASVGPENPVAAADNSRPIKPSEVGRSMLQQLDKLQQAAREQANDLQAEPAAEDAAKQHASEAAQQANNALQNAQAGKFTGAAEQLRKAGSESRAASNDLNDNETQDKKSQLQQQGDNLNRMADAVGQLQQDSAAQVAAQQDSQREVAEAAAEVPQSLNELAERMNLPALGMQHLAQPARDAANSAQEAAVSGTEAAEQLDQTQMQQAGQSAQQSAEKLNRAAQLAQQAADGHRDPNALIPSEVGESVNDALHSLQKASELMNAESQRRAAEEQAQQAEQSGREGQAESTDSNEGPSGEESGKNPPGQNQSGQSNSEAGKSEGQDEPGSGEPGSGEPGSAQSGENKSEQGQPGQQGQQPGQGGAPGQPADGRAFGQSPGNSAQQLANAAKALQSAAKRALPNQFSPGQLNSDGSTASGDPQGKGNPAEFDGRNPKATSRKSTGRKWGQLQDELDSNIGDAGKEVLDNEYSELIRRYRRDLARSADKEAATKTDPKK